MKNNSKKIMKSIKINGVKVDIEVSKEEAKSFPKRLKSTIKIEDKQLAPISGCSVHL